MPKIEKEPENGVQTIRIYRQEIRIKFDRQKCAMHKTKSEKREKNKSNRTDKSRKSQKVWREGKLQVLGNNGSSHHQTRGNERKTSNQTLQLKFHQRDKNHNIPSCKILRILLKMDKGRIQINKPNPVSHNRVQMLSIPVSLLACSQDWTSNPPNDCLHLNLGNQRL